MGAMNFDLDDVALFLRVAELGSLSAAARERHAPVSLVSRCLARLEAQGVEIRTRSRWSGWRDGALVFETPDGERLERPDAVVLALGGASWPRLGSDGAWTPWLEVHTESRELSDFNEAGWDRAWATAAEICKRRPEMAGMLGSSWFYDPPLEQISPRLAYLRLNPLKHGAFMIHQGPGDIHTQRAATSSPTRAALIEKGEYTARSWIVAWPRAALIRWADARKATEMSEAA